jgi:hypothetical protein
MLDSCHVIYATDCVSASGPASALQSNRTAPDIEEVWMHSEPDPLKFEDVWRQTAFAPLVEIALAAGHWIRKTLARRPWRVHQADDKQPRTT